MRRSPLPGMISASALQSSGDLAGAADAYEHALAIDPANDATRNNYAYMLVETRQADRAIEESHKVLARDSSDTSALMNIGYAYLKKGDFDSAEKAYRQTLDHRSKLWRRLITTSGSR